MICGQVTMALTNVDRPSHSGPGRMRNAWRIRGSMGRRSRTLFILAINASPWLNPPSPP